VALENEETRKIDRQEALWSFEYLFDFRLFLSHLLFDVFSRSAHEHSNKSLISETRKTASSFDACLAIETLNFFYLLLLGEGVFFKD
jgi:hypothetical protein